MKHLPAIANRFVFSLLVVNLCGTAFSQGIPPDISRWSGSTAQSQALGFSQGDPLRLTWGFAAEGINIPGNGNPVDFPAANNNIRAFFNGIYGNQGVWQPFFQQTFDRWAAVSGLQYSFEANDDGAGFINAQGSSGVRADVRIAAKPLDGNSGTLAYNYFPNTGDMVFDSNDNFYANNTANNSRALRNVTAHEHGHGLGMSHVDPVSQTKLMEPFVSTAYDGPQHHDILLAQRGYGDVNEKSNNQLGNDIFSRATALGAINGGGLVSIGNSARTEVGISNAVDFVSIDDNTDTDYFSFSVNQASTADITLESLGLIYNVGPQNGNTGPFNSRLRSDLALALFDTNGTSLIQFANATGLGGIEMMTGVNLASAGTYFVRVTGADNPDQIALDTQFYGLSIAITAAAIPEPGALALLGMGALAAAFKRRRSV